MTGLSHDSAACMMAWICSMIIDVKRRETIAVLGCVIKQLAEGNQCHEKVL